MFLDTLYKITTTGAVQTWVLEYDESTGYYRKITGQLEGRKTTSGWTIPKATNKGRANARSVVEQGLAEAQAEWAKKLKDGYSTSPDEAQVDDRFQCMLAEHYDHEKDKGRRKAQALLAATAGHLYSQPKLDGIRLIATKGAMLSRKNRPIVMAPHIVLALEPLFEEFPDLVLDGELYNHDYRDDFDGLISLAKKQKPTAEEIKQAEVLQYHVYDVALDKPYADRYEILVRALGGLDSRLIKLVDTEVCSSEEDVDRAYDKYLGQGYEGQMLRIVWASYENKRSGNLLKRKEYEDAEFVVLGIEEGLGNRAGAAGFAAVRDPATDLRFKAAIKANKKGCKELLEKAAEYVGGEVTVRFNGRTPRGVPRFPRAVAWYPGGRTV